LFLNTFNFPTCSWPNMIDGITAEFKKGEVSLVTVPNGIGKTTLINILLGILQNLKAFFEEYIRAIIVNNSQGGLKKYNKLQCCCLLPIMRRLVKLDRNVLEDYFRDVDDIKRMFVLNDLRNKICHNKIILQLDDPQNIMETFYSVLPDDRCENYKSKINGSIEDL